MPNAFDMSYLHGHAPAGCLHLPAGHLGPSHAERFLTYDYDLISWPYLLVCVYNTGRQQGAFRQEVADRSGIGGKKFCRKHS